MNLYINSGMQLDTCHFMTIEFVFCSNSAYFIMVYITEDTAHVSYNSSLSTIMNIIVSDNMRADSFFSPSNMTCQKYGFHLMP